MIGYGRVVTVIYLFDFLLGPRQTHYSKYIVVNEIGSVDAACQMVVKKVQIHLGSAKQACMT